MMMPVVLVEMTALVALLVVVVMMMMVVVLVVLAVAVVVMMVKKMMTMAVVAAVAVEETTTVFCCKGNQRPASRASRSTRSVERCCGATAKGYMRLRLRMRLRPARRHPRSKSVAFLWARRRKQSGLRIPRGAGCKNNSIDRSDYL
jgi:hypothetical protein